MIRAQIITRWCFYDLNILSNGLDGFKADLKACTSHTNNGMHSDHWFPAPLLKLFNDTLNNHQGFSIPCIIWTEMVSSWIAYHCLWLIRCIPEVGMEHISNLHGSRWIFFKNSLDQFWPILDIWPPRVTNNKCICFIVEYEIHNTAWQFPRKPHFCLTLAAKLCTKCSQSM